MDSNPAPVPVARTRYGSAIPTAPRRRAAAGTRERAGSLHVAPSHAADPSSPTSLHRVHALARRMWLRLATCDSVTFGAGRSWRETLKFATRANACADQRPTSAPSRARVLIWGAAGLLRRLRCGRVRAADAPPATEPLSLAARRVPALCPVITQEDFDASRSDTANSRELLPPKPAACASGSGASASPHSGGSSAAC